jgi:hypothetical protein
LRIQLSHVRIAPLCSEAIARTLKYCDGEVWPSLFMNAPENDQTAKVGLETSQ